MKEIRLILFELECSHHLGGRGGGGRGGDAKTIISPNTSFGDIIRSNWSRFEHCSESTHLGNRKSYLAIICLNSHKKLELVRTESLVWSIGSHIWSLFTPIHMKTWPKVKLGPKFKSVRTLLRITHLAYTKSYLVIICPN